MVIIKSICFTNVKASSIIHTRKNQTDIPRDSAHPDATRSALNEDPEFNRLFDAEDMLTEEWVEKSDKLSLQMKEEITKILKSNNYDGVIIKNDAGSFGRSVET